MAKSEALLASLEKTYERAKAEEAGELHNAIVDILNQHKTSIENSLFVLDIVRFALMEAKYKEILGIVKLTDKPPLPKMSEKK